MSLPPGAMAGPYRIESLLGAGGMGEVYRARDTRLNRDVAVKILSGAAAGADRLRRFEQEARAVAALEHPNILAVHDLGVLPPGNGGGPQPYLVTELLEGQSLRQRLQSGGLPARKVAEYGAAIAAGLAAAHGRGIVHRDLKPENIFLTRDDRVKILDFGLAKAAVLPVTAAPGGATPSTAPTLAAATQPGAAATQPGMLLGTVGYMAPEQAKGQAADARSDIFSLGAVLYEMASGRRAFQGASGVETLNAIIRDDPPDLAAVPSGGGREVPPALGRIIDRCLEKAPERRLQSAQDLAFALENLTAAGGSSHSGLLPAPGAGANRWPARWSWWITPVAVAIAIALSWVWPRAPAAGPPPVYTQLTFRHGTINNARFEPHGAGIVYSAEWDGAPPELFEIRAGEQQPRALGIAGSLAAVSLSGQLAVIEHCQPVFFDQCQGTLAVSAGLAARPVASDVTSAAWSPTGQLAAVRSAGGASQLEYPLGHVVWEAPLGGFISAPRFSPDGRWIAFLRHVNRNIDAGSVEVIAAGGGQPRALAAGFASVHGLAWTPDGRHVLTAGSLHADVSDAIREVSLDGHGDRVLARFPSMVQLRDLAPGGRVLLAKDNWRYEMLGHFPGMAPGAVRNLTWQDWTIATALSPDGRQVIFCECGRGGGAKFSAYIRPTDGGPALRLGDGEPTALSPDGQYVLAASVSKGQFFDLTMLPVGPGSATPLPLGSIQGFVGAAYLPNSLALLEAGVNGGTVRLYRQALRADLPVGLPQPIGSPTIGGGPVSPDSQWIPQRLAADQKWYLLPTSADHGQPRLLPWLTGKDQPLVWSSDGRHLFVRDNSGVTATIVAVDVATGRRQVVLTITPRDLAGVRGAASIVLTPDVRYYAYNVPSFRSQLLAASGFRLPR